MRAQVGAVMTCQCVYNLCIFTRVARRPLRTQTAYGLWGCAHRSELLKKCRGIHDNVCVFTRAARRIEERRLRQGL